MRILLVEDQPKLGAHLVRGLGEDGHVVEHVKDGVAAAAAGLRGGHDVVVLDWALPGRDGLDVLKEWRSRGLKTPVLMLTARDTLEERVLALRSGADDHLGKPFAYDELLARLEALHRRAGGGARETLGDVELDREAHTLLGPRDTVTLTAREYTLLAELRGQRGEVCTRARLLQTVWGDDLEVAQNVVDVYVGYLRQKLSACGARRVRIVTVRGAGYRLVVDDEPTTP
jgi:two-component system, OmpR family, response regulator